MCRMMCACYCADLRNTRRHLHVDPSFLIRRDPSRAKVFPPYRVVQLLKPERIGQQVPIQVIPHAALTCYHAKPEVNIRCTPPGEHFAG
jgi:hypothetical protein